MQRPWLLIVFLCCISLYSAAQQQIYISPFSIQQLVEDVNTIPIAAPHLNSRTSLLAKLMNAQAAYEREASSAAVGMLRAFTNELAAYSGSAITAVDSSRLIVKAERTINAINLGLRLGGAQVGTTGCTITISDSASSLRGVSIEFPPGALSSEVFIGLEESTTPDSVLQLPGIHPIAPWTRLLPAGLTFNKPITLRFPYDEVALASNGIGDPQAIGGLLAHDDTMPPEGLPTMPSLAAKEILTTVGSFSKVGLFARQEEWRLENYRWTISPIKYFIKTTRPQSVFRGRESIIREAFAAWQAQSCGLRFEETTNEAAAQIVIQDFIPFLGMLVFEVIDRLCYDNTLNLLGKVESVYFEQSLESNDRLTISINSDAIMLGLVSMRDTVLRFTAMHELGHAIGIAHSKHPGVAVMSSPLAVPCIKTGSSGEVRLFQALQAADIQAVQSQYGAACPPPPPPPLPTPPTCSLTATPPTVNPGQSSTLSWTVSNNPTAGSIAPGVGPVSLLLPLTVSPTQSTTYTLTVSNVAGSGTCGATVTVSPQVPGGALWTLVTPPSHPPALYDPKMAYDSARKEVVLFGLNGTVSPALFETWTWNGSDWSNRTPAVSPTFQQAPVMAFDRTRNEVVLYNCMSGFGAAETWTWNGSSWSLRTNSGPPLRFGGSAMAYDAIREEIVLFGGNTPGSALADTWVWNGSSWTQRFPTVSPPPTKGHAMVFDSVRSEVLLIGGQLVGADWSSADTWAWNGATWAKKSPAVKPPGRFWHAAGFDEGRGSAVVFGGQNMANTTLGDTWQWDGLNWQQVTASSSPSPRSRSGFVFDADRSLSVLFGGYSAASSIYPDLADTWFFGGSTTSSNLLTNPNFDRDLAGWSRDSVSSHSAVWSSIDANGLVTSGSIELTNSSPSAGSGALPAWQCVSATAGATYQFGAMFYIDAGQMPGNWAAPGVYWFSGPNCTGSVVGGKMTPVVTSTGSWVSASETATAPVGTASASFWFEVHKAEAGGLLRVRGDRAFLSRAGN